jgi:hypothetical protein
MPYTSDNPEPLRESDQTVRFYFSVSVLCLIPPNQHGGRDSVPDADWEKDRLERVEADLKARLSMVGFEAAYPEHMLVDEARRLYVTRFAVCAPCSFSAAQVFTARKGYSGFRVKKMPLLKAKAIQETKIAAILSELSRQRPVAANALAPCRTLNYRLSVGHVSGPFRCRTGPLGMTMIGNRYPHRVLFYVKSRMFASAHSTTAGSFNS